MCIALPPGATDAEIDTLCQRHTARLDAWIDQRRAQVDGDAGAPAAITVYDGSVRAACRIYQEHPYSRFNTRQKGNTRRTNLASLKILENEVGGRQIPRLNVLDVQHWYDVFRLPVLLVQEDGSEVLGPERIDRAYDAIAMFKTVLRFNAALGRKDCERLLYALKNAGSLVTFETGAGREEVMTYAQVLAFVRKALELGDAGHIPLERARYLAIAAAAQFELMLRQKDVIGERPLTRADLEKAIARGATQLDGGNRPWVGYFTWEAIDAWRWSMRTSKSKYKKRVSFDLSIYGLLSPLLEAVPLAERTGAVIKGEHGLPMQERSYRKWFREVAREAGLPDTAWNMDLRASGASESEVAGADFAAIRDLLTHSRRQEETTIRYLRRQEVAAERTRAQVQEAREALRKVEGGEDA